MSKCWNSYSPGDQTRDREERSLLAGTARRTMSGFAVNPARVYIAGLSAGGAGAAADGLRCVINAPLGENLRVRK